MSMAVARPSVGQLALGYLELTKPRIVFLVLLTGVPALLMAGRGWPDFRTAFGETPHQYLLTRRLERAAALLRSTDRGVAEICFLVGLRSVGSFTTSFGRAYGRTPTAYRAACPPAADYARIPTCMLAAYARPASSRFGEDRSTTRK